MQDDFQTVYPPPVGAGAAERSVWQRYHGATRTATYGFLSALPLLLLYEGLILLLGHGRVMQVRVGADVWIKSLLAALGASGGLALGVAVLLIGGAILYAERHRDVRLRAGYFSWMVAESAVYAVVVALVVSNVVAVLFAITLGALDGWPMAAVQAAQPGFAAQLALSIGAGLYEELFFRVLLVGGLYFVLKRLLPKRRYAYLVAAVVGALLFSAVHYTGSLGDVFTLRSFAFRFLFGLALNALFLWRGFGVAAWTHALYDVMVVSRFFG